MMLIFPGKELSPAQIEVCVSVLEKGEAVDWEYAEEELPCAVAVALLTVDNEIVGVGAIKRRRTVYATKIAQRSGFSFNPKWHELGYVAVLPTHRNAGNGGKIVESLLNTFPGPLWATTYEDRMKSTLEHRGFVPGGKEWLSKNKQHQLSLWIKGAQSSVAEPAIHE
jgi:GNAT superfamily N-acetyltransferase